MSVQITLSILDEVYHYAERIAQLSGRDVIEILTTTLSAFVSSSYLFYVQRSSTIESLTDDEVLAFSEKEMDEIQNKRWHSLLGKQQTGTISPDEAVELETLTKIRQDGLGRKAQALAEAVRRGLREPLVP